MLYPSLSSLHIEDTSVSLFWMGGRGGDVGFANVYSHGFVYVLSDIQSLNSWSHSTVCACVCVCVCVCMWECVHMEDEQ